MADLDQVWPLMQFCPVCFFLVKRVQWCPIQMRAFHSNENGLFCTHPLSVAPLSWWKERGKQEALIWIKNSHLNRTLQYAFIWRTCRIFVSTFSLEAKDLHRSSTHPLKWTLLLMCRKEGGCFWRLLYKKHQKQGSNVWKESLCMKSHGNDVPSQSFFTAFDYSIHANNSLFKGKKSKQKRMQFANSICLSGVSVKTSLLLALPAIAALRLGQFRWD